MPKRHRALSVFGLNVRRQREARRFTQENLAEKADLGSTRTARGATNFVADRPQTKSYVLVQYGVPTSPAPIR